MCVYNSAYEMGMGQTCNNIADFGKKRLTVGSMQSSLYAVDLRVMTVNKAWLNAGNDVYSFAGGQKGGLQAAPPCGVVCSHNHALCFLSVDFTVRFNTYRPNKMAAYGQQQ